jgi:hypothetical protein
VQEVSGPGGEKLAYPYKRSLPAWVFRRSKDFVPTGKLVLLVDGPGTRHRSRTLRESSRQDLTELLPHVFVIIEVAGRELQRDADERAVELGARQAEWEAAMATAKTKHKAAQLRETIAARAEAWRLDRELSVFLDALEQRMPEMNEEQRAIAAVWHNHGRVNVRGSDHFDELPPLRFFFRSLANSLPTSKMALRRCAPAKPQASVRSQSARVPQAAHHGLIRATTQSLYFRA